MTTAWSKLDAVLESAVEDAEERAWIRPRVAQLLSLEGRSDLEQAELFAGWRLFFERLAERDPVVLVFEDMQWADAPLLEFVAYLLEWSRNHAILVVALTRPGSAEGKAQWAAGLRNATTLSLEPLSTEAMETLLDGFVPGLSADASHADPRALGRSSPLRRRDGAHAHRPWSARAGWRRVPPDGPDRGARST